MTAALAVLCIGNALRGDDGAGRAVALRLRALRDASIAVVDADAPYPEHAALLADAADFVLVDASTRCYEARLTRIDDAANEDGDLCASLRAMALTLYGRAARCWLCEVPAARFDEPDRLSARCADGVDAAVALIASLHGRAGQ